MITQALRSARQPIRKFCVEAGQVYYSVTGSHQVECNICHYKARHLQSDNWHPHTICPQCRSQVRQRLLWACLTTLPATSLRKLVANKMVLHFAPEKDLGRLLRHAAGAYQTADFLTDGYDYGELDYQIDITDMRAISDEQYDCVIACDVLEHVSDHIGAMREVWRILRPGGVLHPHGSAAG